MASTIIHIAIANEVNKELKKDNQKILIGAIAPDISKLVGESKVRSHFLDNKKDGIPNLKKFLKKYKNNLEDSFVLGYYIHLYTDYLWFKYFITEIIKEDCIKKLDGSIMKVDKKTKIKYIYNDYSNLNNQLIDKYNLNLEIFYNKLPKIKKIIKEIPLEKMDLLIEKTNSIIENSKNEKNLIFDIKDIEQFIKISTELIVANLKQIKKS